MKSCEICGKISTEVAFDARRGKHLCLSCKFGSGEFHTQRIKKQTGDQEKQIVQQQPQAVSAQSGEAQESSSAEQRKHPRVPVLISLDVIVGGVKSQMFYPSAIQNFSRGGICLDWNHCTECSGYKDGGIHPFCIFSQFAINNPGGKQLTLRLEIANTDQEVEFKGQVAYTSKKKNTEFLGISFTEISTETMDLLEKMCATQ